MRSEIMKTMPNDDVVRFGKPPMFLQEPDHV